MMQSVSKKRAAARSAVVFGAVALGIAALAGPAAAGPSETDRPKVTKTHHDFGENWTLGAPRNGGHLEWELNGSGDVTADLTGNHYLTDEACGRVRVEYYAPGHVLLGTDDSGLHCAPGNAKTQWFVSESFVDTTATLDHLHVELEDGSGSFIGSDTADFD